MLKGNFLPRSVKFTKSRQRSLRSLVHMVFKLTTTQHTTTHNCHQSLFNSSPENCSIHSSHSRKLTSPTHHTICCVLSICWEVGGGRSGRGANNKNMRGPVQCVIATTKRKDKLRMVSQKVIVKSNYRRDCLTIYVDYSPTWLVSF